MPLLAGLFAVGLAAVLSAVRFDTASPGSFRPRPLTSEPGFEQRPALAVDGTKLAYVARDDDGSPALYVRPVAGGGARKLSGGLVPDSPVAWSPSGDLIACWRAARDAARLVVVDTESERVIRECHEPERQANLIDANALDWHPSGKAIAMATGSPYRITLLDLHAGERTALTNPPQGIPGDTLMAFAPDGQRLAFVRFTTFSESDVYLLDTRTGAETRLTTDKARVWGLDWDPDGRALIYSADPGPGRSALHWLDLSTRQTRQLTEGSYAAEFPSVARNHAGETIVAYESKRRHDNIWVLNDSEPASVAASTWMDAYPAVTDASVAFVSERSGTYEIWTAAIDGGDVRRLTHMNGPYTDMPRWSPDGTRIAFTSADERGNRDIYVVAKSGAQTRITKDDTEEGRASWSHDGQWLYFRSDRTGTPQIWKTTSTGNGAPRQITTGGGYEAFEDPSGERLYYIKTREQAELWSVPIDGGEEERLTEGPREARWAVTTRGIIYADGRALKRYDTTTRETTTLRELPCEPRLGFSASRDGERLAWSQTDLETADIWLATLSE